MSTQNDTAAVIYQIGPFIVDTATQQFAKGSDVIPLTPKVFATLLVLLENRNRCVSKEELIQNVWHDTAVSDESLTQNIFTLRRAFGDDSARPAYIATLPRRGYRFIAPVSVVSPTEVPVDESPALSDADQQAATDLRPATRRLLTVGIAVVLAALAGTYLIFRSFAHAPTIPVIQYRVFPPSGTTFVGGGLPSPDGRNLAFIARDLASARQQIWIMAVDTSESRRLADTDGAVDAFWSPDGQSIAFLTGNRLRRVTLAGVAQTITQVEPDAGGGSWYGNTILFSQGRNGIYAVPAEGGMARAVTTNDRRNREWTHARPQWLPDGKHFLFAIVSLEAKRSGTYIASIDGREKTQILDDSAHGVRYAEPGFLLYVRNGEMFADPFDITANRPQGTPMAFAGAAVTPVEASNNGFLAFGGTPRSHLAWFDRTGKRLGQVEAPVTLHTPALFRDNLRILAGSADESRGGVWMVDLERGTPAWAVPDGAAAVPSPNGSLIGFSSARLAGVADLYVRSVDGAGTDRLVFQSNQTKVLQDWTPDEQSLIFTMFSNDTQSDVWQVSIADGKAAPLVRSASNETQAKISPDGRWLAYISDESGQSNVHLQSLTSVGRKMTISSDGGLQAVWRRDGRELFYLSPAGMLTSVSITPGLDPNPGLPRPLFAVTLPAAPNMRRPDYSVSADGQRFLVDSFDSVEQNPITVVFNWPALLKR